MNSLKQFEQKTMKQNILLLIAVVIVLFAASNCRGQGKLPDTVTICLSQRDLFAISQRIDSLQNIMAATSTLPANQVTSFNQRLNIALSVMYNQIRAQIVADKPKEVVKPVKKQ